MDIIEYYRTVWNVIKNNFELHAGFFIGTHKPDLLSKGWNPNTHPLVEVLELPVNLSGDNALKDRTCNKGYEVFLPVVGRNNETILAPLDFEIFLDDENHRLYGERDFQKDLLVNYIKPLSDMIEKLFMGYGIPYTIDYTPSGFHLLFLVKRNTSDWNGLAGIGYLEPEMLRFINTIDTNDVKRKEPVDFDTASVFSGIARLSSYISLLLFQEYNSVNRGCRAAICDSDSKCVNLDLSWAGDPAIMRCIRGTATPHRKNSDKFGFGSEPLVDVIFSYFDGEKRLGLKKGNNFTVTGVEEPEDTDIESVVDAMWNLDAAACISGQYEGIIPYTNDSLITLINDYKASELYRFHREFDSKYDLKSGEGSHRFFNDGRLSQDSKNMLHYPVPNFLSPKYLKRFVNDCIGCGWAPKHIGNGIRDIYMQNTFNFPFHKYPAETKANFYAMTYSALSMIEEKKMRIE